LVDSHAANVLETAQRHLVFVDNSLDGGALSESSPNSSPELASHGQQHHDRLAAFDKLR
jgi:hypothetical protein